MLEMQFYISCFLEMELYVEGIMTSSEYMYSLA
jgi:hypothetical protein